MVQFFFEFLELDFVQLVLLDQRRCILVEVEDNQGSLGLFYFLGWCPDSLLKNLGLTLNVFDLDSSVLDSVINRVYVGLLLIKQMLKSLYFDIVLSVDGIQGSVVVCFGLGQSHFVLVLNLGKSVLSHGLLHHRCLFDCLD